jgi:hypothetical protein
MVQRLGETVTCEMPLAAPPPTRRRAGKGSKRRPYKAKQFAANYEAIRWGKRQSKRRKVKP